MSNIPGYNPTAVAGSAVGKVSYPATYQGVRAATYNSASPVPVGNVTFRAQPGAGSGGGKKKGGNSTPKQPKPFTCCNKHPVQALKELRPDAKFDVLVSYQTDKGAAIVVATTVDGVVYQGEGTTGQIARAIAAHKALVGMNATEHNLLQPAVNFQEQKDLVMQRISLWQDLQAKKESKKLEREKMEKEAAQRKEEKKQRIEQENESRLANKKKKENNGFPKPVEGQLFLDYGYLIQRYGPDVAETTTQMEEKTETGCPQFKCVLVVQGFTFESTSTSKKGARNQAVSAAHTAFAENPPPIVNEKKRKIPNKTRSAAGDEKFIPIDPTEFEDKLAEKCWNFVTEQIADVADNLKLRRNLAVIVKVDGSDSLENCEMVAFGSGTLLIKKENMTTEGTVINDCTGESLALRALRRYLLDQLELCLTGKTSIYIKDRSGGKCSLKKSIKLYLYTNSCPMGDSRAITLNKPPPAPSMEVDSTTADPVKQEVKDEQKAKPVPMETGDSAKPRKTKYWMPRKSTSAKENLGKVTFFSTHADFGSSEGTTVYDKEKSHCIVSPSDKLAVRQMCGVQGSILYSLTSPVYISHYFINRAYNEPAISRALYERVKGTKLSNNKDVIPEPKFTKVLWKATRIEEKRTKWGLIWAKGHLVEVIYTPEGKQYHAGSIEGGEIMTILGDIKGHLAQSEYCTKALYTAYVNVCRKSKKTYPQRYSVLKSANTRYRMIKTAVLTHLKESGLGEWSVNPSKPDY